MRLPNEFYNLATLELAPALLGQKLCTKVRGRLTSGTIVEVEAYLGVDDPACHASRGPTPRNQVMFQSPGHCYVYFIYGMYYCLNVVSDAVGVGSAVLIRAVEPLDGIATMQYRRGNKIRPIDLTSGPGKLTEAFGVSKNFSGEHFATSELIWLEAQDSVPENRITRTSRIGISVAREKPWRFYISGNPFVSRVAPKA